MAVTANGNDVDSPDKSVTVSGTAAGGNNVSNPSNVTLTLEDDDGLPTVALVLAPTSIAETGGVSTVTATLSGPSSAAVTVTVAAAAGTGAVSGDFSLSAANTLTIAAGSTTSGGTVTVTANGNAVDSPNKSVTVSGTAAGGNGVANPSNVTLTITDDDALPTVSLVLAPSSITETGGVATVTATLSGASSGAVTVTVAAAAGTGAVSGDFSLSAAKTLTIAAGSTTSGGTVTVTANGNDVDSPNKSVTVSGTAAGGNGVADPSDATLTITDDDALPTVSLVLSPTSITETNGVATVTATLTGKSSEVLTVTVAAAAVSPAIAGDFALSTAKTLTIAAGSTASTGTVTVTAEPNDVDAANRSVTVSGTAAGGNGVANPPNVTLTLTDDDTAGIAVSPSTSATSRLVTTESGGTATFEVKLDSEPTGNVVLGVASSDTDEGTAAPSALTFTPSDWSTAQTVTLTGVDDSPPVADGSRNYTATLTVNQTDTQDSTYDALSARTVYARNRDNEFGLAVGAVSGQATEAGGTATFTVALLTQPSAAVTVAVSSRDPGEGTISPQSLTFTTLGWNTARTVTVTGVQDTVDDGTATWAVRLDPSSGDADYDALDSEDVSVTTTDDDGPPGVSLSLNPAGIAESGAGNVSTVTARLSHPSGAATTLTVTAVAGAFTAGAGADATIVIAAGATAGTDTALVTATDNTTDAPDRTATVTATVANARAAADSTVMAVTGAVLTITDDDAAPTVTLSVNPTSVSENGGVATVTAVLSHSSSEPTTVTVAAVSGLYTAGTDATIVIAAGETANASDTATVTATDDTIHQDTAGRSVTVTATPANGQGVGTVTGATLTLTDDETRPTVTLVLAPDTIAENGGVSTVTATLSGASGEAVTVAVAAVPVSPATAADFTLSTATTLTIAAGSTASTGTVTVTAVRDPDVSEPKRVRVTAAASGGLGVADPPDEILTITDEKYGLVLDPADGVRGQATEGGGTATFAVALLTRPSAPVTVAVTGLDATEGRVAPSVLTFATGNWGTAQTVTVTGTDDDTDDGDVSWKVRLDPSSGDAGYAGLADAEVDVTTADDDGPPGVVLSLDPASIPENGGVTTVTAVLTHPSDADTTVTVTASPVASSGATEGDYTLDPSSNMIVIAAGSISDAGTVTVAATDNDADAADKAVAVSGTAANARAATDGTAVAVTGAVLTIRDDDEKGFAFEPGGTVRVAVGNGAAAYAAKLTSRPTGTVTVRISPDDADLTVSPSVLTFTPSDWNGARTVTVTARPDGDDLADEVSVVRHAASGGGYDGVAGTLYAAVCEPGDTGIVAGGAAGMTTHCVNGVIVTLTITPLPEEDWVEAAGSGHGLGPAESLVAVDVAVDPVPPDGVRLCLPVTAGLRTAAKGRTLILLRRGEPVEGSVDEGARVCADGVASFSPFALGYADTAPVFPEFAMTAMVFTVGEAIAPVTLPEAEGGDRTVHRLEPRPPPGLDFDDGTRILSGTPTEASAERRYVWAATDIDGEKDELAFTIEVVPAPALARERLAAINRSVLPELARATWGSVTDAVAARLESPDAPGGDVLMSGLTGAAEFLRSNGRAIGEGSASWRELLGGESFAVGLGSGAQDDADGSPAVAWGSGDWRRLALDKPELEWSGDLFAGHMGVDAPLGGGLRGGVAASWTEGEIEYTDRSGDDDAVTGVHVSRLASVHPYAGWSGPDGWRLWGALGYGEGGIKITDAEVAERFGVQKAGSTFMGVAVGASVPPVVSSDGLAVSLKGSGEAVRYSVRDNGSQIAAVSVDTRRVRLAAEANRSWALPDGGTLTPSLEVGARWDGGDGETGAGMELGSGLEWASDGLSVGAHGRALVAHRGAVEEWGVSGSARLSPGSGGRGWSFALTPRWGTSESGLAQLWDEGMAGRASPGAADKVRLETELGYGFAFRRGAGVMTPHAGFDYEAGGTRRWSLGTRFAFGPDFDVGLEAEREEGAAGPGHAARIDLRLKW